MDYADFIKNSDLFNVSWKEEAEPGWVEFHDSWDDSGTLFRTQAEVEAYTQMLIEQGIDPDSIAVRTFGEDYGHCWEQGELAC